MSEYSGVDAVINKQGRGVFNRGIALWVGLGLSMASARADVIRAGAQHFTEVGVVASFQYAPPSYTDEAHPNSFFYDVFYYIPASLKDKSSVKSLVFKHGGGPSTFTRDNAIDMLKTRYLSSLVQIADSLNIIVVLPCSNGLNWNNNSVDYLRDVAAMMRTELDVDPDQIGLSGHSMGGMGIVRNYSYLTDQFAFFIPMAAGMDFSKSTPAQAEWQANKVFNVTYIHIQGLQDKFTEFVARCKEQVALTETLEIKYGLKSKLKMLFMGADHDMQGEALKLYAAKAFREGSRNLYQTELWGTVRINDEWTLDNKKLYHVGSVSRYFWVEARDFDLTKPEVLNFHAKVEGQSIQIELPETPKSIRTFRVYLHSSMLNLKQPITFFVNQVKVAVRLPSAPHHLRSFDSTDPSFKFDDFVDLAI